MGQTINSPKYYSNRWWYVNDHIHGWDKKVMLRLERNVKINLIRRSGNNLNCCIDTVPGTMELPVSSENFHTKMHWLRNKKLDANILKQIIEKSLKM